MYPRSVLLALLAALAPGCKTVDCGDGTTERNGLCVAPSQTVGAAKCGPFTVLHGDLCVVDPKFPVTVCDPGTTAEELDPGTGVTTCVGTGAGGCSARLACPVGTNNKQTICGQIFDFETGQPFAASSATGAQCGTGATAGPCALGFKAYDAVAFAQSGGAGGALTTGAVYIDDCGRFRIPDVSQPAAAPVIALGVDDIAAPGPTGLTNAVGVTTMAIANGASRDVEAFVVKPSTTAGWSGTSLATGIFALVFHNSLAGSALAAGVTMTRNGAAGDTAHTFYFGAVAANRTTLDSNARATGVNGTALYNIMTPMLTDMYSGTGGLPSGCNWEAHGGVALQGLVFVQTFRPTGSTCPP
jgi:hypothetical protein